MMPDLRGVGFAEVRNRITGNRLEVYARLLEHGPATCTELAAVMGWDKCSVRPRITELADLSHVVATGVRRDCEHEFKALTATQAETMHKTRADTPAPAPAQPQANGDRRGVASYIPAPFPPGTVPAVQTSFF